MGHKVHPKIFRIGSIFSWDSKWFARRKNYAELVKEDVGIKEYLKELLKDAGVDRIELERKGDSLSINVYVAKPGVVIGRSGAGAEELKKKLTNKFWRGKKQNFNINIFEVKRSSLSANVILRGMVVDLERRVPFRRVMKQAIERAKKAGAKGVKINVSGRLNGADIARTEKLLDGNVPLQNLRADIDYACGIAKTIYGVIGVKVWVYRGEVFEDKENKKDTSEDLNKEKK